MSKNGINKGMYWTPKPEVWDAKKCAKIAKRRSKDGYGTRHPYPGFIEADSAPYGYGKRSFNGGIVRDNEWWEGTNVPLPVVPPEYVFIHRLSWGMYLIRRDEIDESETIPAEGCLHPFVSVYDD